LRASGLGNGAERFRPRRLLVDPADEPIRWR
jgi:hypothetical protein